MRKAAFVFTSLLTVSLMACDKPGGTKPAGGTSGPAPSQVSQAPKMEELIIGKWEALDEKKKGTFEFVKGGDVVVAIEGGPTMKGKFKFLEADTVDIELASPKEGEPSMKQKVKVKVDKDNLEMTDEKKEVDKFKRAK